jgi:hypothetical protein
MAKKLFSTLKTLACGGLLASTGLLVWSTDALASSGGQGLSDIVNNVQTNIITLGPLLTIVSYIAGVGFAIAGIVQFKAHKDNPTQVPLSKPLVYLGVGAALLFLPSIMASAGTTIFGGSQVSAGKGQTGLQ